MSRTKRSASRWFEQRFKHGDPVYPEDNPKLFNGRYQAKMRNGNQSRYAPNLDPLTMKITTWRDSTSSMKADAIRSARHKAKILLNQQELEHQE